MKRWLVFLARHFTGVIVGFFPLLAVLFLLIVEPVARRVLIGVAGAALLLLVLLSLFARRDRELGQALRLGCMLLVMAIGCGTLFALLLGSRAKSWTMASFAPDEPAAGPTIPPQSLRLWHRAAPEWMREDDRWPWQEPLAHFLFPPAAADYRIRPLVGGEYEIFLTQPLQAMVVVAPWGQVPGDDVVLQARARWEGISRDGVWGVVCRYQGPRRFYALVLSGQGRAAIWKHTPNGAWALASWTSVPALASPTAALQRPQAAYRWTPSPSPRPWEGPRVAPSPTSVQAGPRLQQGYARLRAECWGDLLRLSVNDVVVLQVRDATYTGGRVGLWAVAPPAGRHWRVIWQTFDAYVPATR